MIKRSGFPVIILFVLAAVASLLYSTPVKADSYGTASYFEGYPGSSIPLWEVWPDGFLPEPNGFIPRYYNGSNSFIGYVMPSHNGARSQAVNNVWNDGNGAVGYHALGVSASVAMGNSPADNKKRKEALFNFLQQKNRNGSTWEKTGSALVVHQMTGKQWGWGTRVIGDDQWAELKTKLVDNDQLIMKMSTYGRAINTAGVFVNSNGTYDVIKYYYDIDEAVDAWVFYEGTETNRKFVLEIGCANPLGNFSGLPSHQYSLNPTLDPIGNLTTPGGGASVNVGDRLEVKSHVQNTGPHSSRETEWRLTRFVYRGGWPDDRGSRESSGDACSAFAAADICERAAANGMTTGRVFPVGMTDSIPYTNYSVPALNPGDAVCFVNSVMRPTQNNDGWKHSGMRCVRVVGSPSDFNLIPEIDSDGRDDGSAIESGDSITVRHTVTNTGQNSSGSTIWRLTMYEYSPTAVFDENTQGGRDGGNISNDPCNSFTNSGRVSCDMVQETTTTFSPGAPRVYDPSYTFDIPETAPVGTRFCFVSSVNRPTTSTSPAWRHSAMWCVMVGKKPKVQVWGGDVRSGGKIETSTSQFGGSVFGSWSEYAAMSIGSNSGFASGAGLNNGNSNPAQSSWSRLTFANTGTDPACSFGCFNFMLSAPSVARQFALSTTVLSGTVNLNSLASSTAAYQAGNITLSGTTISRGKTIIVVSEGTVTIDGDILYEDVEYTDIRDIPQVIIRAPRIDIRGGVGQVDAWLLAVSDSSSRSVINTCSDVAVDARLTVADCNRQLTINGPVVADTIYLRRTGGSEPTMASRGEPAEIFNLRADAYIWGNVYGRSIGQAQTVYSRELAPRF